MGALGLASEKHVNSELLAQAAFLHAIAARQEKGGSSASSISHSLAELTTTLQSKDVMVETHNPPKYDLFRGNV